MAAAGIGPQAPGVILVDVSLLKEEPSVLIPELHGNGAVQTPVSMGRELRGYPDRTILGVDDNTGAGGANVWSYTLLQTLLGLRTGVATALPGGCDLRMAMRRWPGAGGDERFVFRLPFTYQVLPLASETGQRPVTLGLPCRHLGQRGGGLGSHCTLRGLEHLASQTGILTGPIRREAMHRFEKAPNFIP